MKLTVIFPALCDNTKKIRFARRITWLADASDEAIMKRGNSEVQQEKRKSMNHQQQGEVEKGPRKKIKKEAITAGKRRLMKLRKEAQLRKKFLEECKLRNRELIEDNY